MAIMVAALVGLSGCASQRPATIEGADSASTDVDALIGRSTSDLPPEVLLPSDIPTEDPAGELINSGRYLDAALLLIDLASALSPPHKQDYQLRVASLLLQGNYVAQADQILKETDLTGLDRDFQIRKSLLGAQLSLAMQSPQKALNRLSVLSNEVSSFSVEQQQAFYRTEMDIHSMMGNYFQSAISRARLNPLLTDENEILETQETLLRDLQNLSANELQQLEATTSHNIMKGWTGLAYIVLTARDEQQARQMFNEWQARYPEHEVLSKIIHTILTKQPEALGLPTQVAVILPMNGRFAKAAKAIRDGFLTAYYADSSAPHRPIIRIYDEGTDPNQITTIYRQAVSDGANFVIGPLNKKAVTRLRYSDEITNAVLSLNYSDPPQTEIISSEANQDISETNTDFGQSYEERPDNNFFQLSLSPEQEAVHVAEHAWLDGHKKAAAIFPDSAWGERVYSAFKIRWEELGGTVVEHQTYDMRKNDYSAPIKDLLNISDSESRYNEIRRLVEGKTEYEPRRRKDVDFIFMAAFSRQGRLLRPQLKFHRASNIPVYATSHVYSGSLEPQMDRDMNGVRFSDMPWTLTSNSALKQQIESTFPSASKRYMRLYALGIDAYKIIPELNRLRRNRFASFQGETGTLYLDVANRLQRKLLWAQFVSGRPKVIQKF